MDDGYVPKFSDRTRTRVYVTGLLAGVACFIGAGVSGIVGATDAAAIFGLVGTALPTVAAGFGVAYRPTR